MKQVCNPSEIFYACVNIDSILKDRLRANLELNEEGIMRPTLAKLSSDLAMGHCGDSLSTMLTQEKVWRDWITVLCQIVTWLNYVENDLTVNRVTSILKNYFILRSRMTSGPQREASMSLWGESCFERLVQLRLVSLTPNLKYHRCSKWAPGTHPKGKDEC